MSLSFFLHMCTMYAQIDMTLILCKYTVLASFPGPTQLSVACSTDKRGEPGIFSHVSDITTNEKLMNVGGLNDNGVIAHVLVPAKTVREFVCFIPCKVYVFADG